MRAQPRLRQPGGRAGLLAWLALVLLAACAPTPPGPLLVDEARLLDRASVAAAAEPLRERGASVAVFAVAAGDDRGEDFSRRLERAGLLPGGQIAPAAIAIYISLQPRYSELRAGAAWSPALPDATLRAIRLERLNPALRADDPTGGVAAALAALDEASRQPALGWWLGVAVAAVALGALGLLALPALRQGWRRSPLRRRLVALWERTPPGRERARRRRAAASAQALARTLAARAEAAAGWRAAAAPDDLLARLDRLDHDCDDLAGRPADTEGLADQLDALTRRYRQLRDELRALDDRLRALESSAERYPRCLAERIARVQAALQRKDALAQRRRGRARPVSEGARRQLAKLQGRLAQAELQRDELAQAPGPPRERAERLSALIAAYAAIEREAGQLWRAECPGDYAAAHPPARRAYEGPAQPSPDSTPFSSSDSSDSTWQSSSDSPGPSSDGGAW